MIFWFSLEIILLLLILFNFSFTYIWITKYWETNMLCYEEQSYQVETLSHSENFVRESRLWPSDELSSRGSFPHNWIKSFEFTFLDYSLLLSCSMVRNKHRFGPVSTVKGFKELQKVNKIAWRQNLT